MLYLEKEISPSKTDALIIVDVQMDFLPGGALPVPEGDQIIPVLNEYIDLLKRKVKIYATRDWHPPNHISFKAQGGPWPPHCIQDSEGAKLHPDLKLPRDVTIISKAMDPKRESYSGFDNTELTSSLRINDVSRVLVAGLATDYCVKNTVLDGLALGFEVVLLSDAIRGINLNPGDAEKAVNAMILRGAKTATLEDFPEPGDIPPDEQLTEEVIDAKPLEKAYKKKKARLRSRGPYRKARIEQ